MQRPSRLRHRWIYFFFCEIALLGLAVSHAALLGTFFGCGGGGDASDTLFSSTTIPPDITEDTSAGLRGLDTNTNGIRDDIDAVIAQKFSTTPELKRSAEQDARAMQQLLEATTKEEALAASEQSDRADACIWHRLPGEENYARSLELGRTIEALTANTRERLKKYLHTNKFFGGMTFRGRIGDPVEEVCDE